MEEEKKKLFGRGIYGSKDVPIRILDGLIVGMILLAVVLTVIFSINGGYRVTFDTRGGGEIPYQNLRSQDMNLCAGREKRQKGSGRLSTIR